MLYTQLFYSLDANNQLSDIQLISNMLKVEAVLAKTQAREGIIPEAAAQVIQGCCNVNFIDIEKLKAEIQLGGNAAIPMVKQLIRTVKNNDFEASKYVHLGATSQDIVDTGLMLSIKDIQIKIEADLHQLLKLLATLAKQHKSTVQIGRTLLQQAKPITFGLKVAYWLQALLDTQERMLEGKKRILQIQLAGSVGSGGRFLTTAVRKHFAKELGLACRVPWQSNRTNLAEWISHLGILCGTLGKMARDVSLLMQTEVGEVFEGAAAEKGGSSTMPHKRNPVTCSVMIANAHRVPHLVASFYGGLMQEHERSAGIWHAEWEVTQQIAGLTAGALEKAIDLIQHLEVDEGRMKQNLEVTHGLIYAENVSLALAPVLGKGNAYDWVHKACEQALKEGKHLKQVIEESEHQLPHLNDLFNPSCSIGNSIEIVDEIIRNYEDKL